MSALWVRVVGLVQGVGFRPHVATVARAHGVTGSVRNAGGAVVIEASAPDEALAAFMRDIVARAPAASRIDDIASSTVASSTVASSTVASSNLASSSFVIAPSTRENCDAARIAELGPDTAPCGGCEAELTAGRRVGHAFISCTSCGPRFTIARALPWDRERTTMARFPLCAACEHEYSDLDDRRGHAEAIGCPSCGPRLGAGALTSFASAMREGAIGALKGVGGYQLVCDASNDDAVARVRAMKRRPDKPLAVMVANVAAADQIVALNDCERALLASPARPIVVAQGRRERASIGVMLPASPLHLLLARAFDGPLVVTSANTSDEPLIIDDDVALRELNAAGAFLLHERAIACRVDDSVAHVIDGAPQVIRRARGYVPAPLAVPIASRRPTLALGAHQKATFALGHGARAVVSHHLGDLDTKASVDAYAAAIDHYESMFGVKPAVLVVDRHPDYASTAYGRARAEREGLALVVVQHHHAHFASCLADHGITERSCGVIFDGAGLGLDDTVWGGELLVGDLARVERRAHLSHVRLPGGDVAAREPWRVALAHLHAAAPDGDDGHELRSRFCARLDADARVGRAKREQVQSLIERGVHAPLTSSAGRLFDAVAALLGLPFVVSYEGQAARALEELALPRISDTAAGPYSTETFDVRPLIRAVCADRNAGTDPALIAARFHNTLAAIVDAAAGDICARERLGVVALSGGVFVNRLLTERCVSLLRARGLRVVINRRVPCNDGGISYGQLAVAAAQEVA